MNLADATWTDVRDAETRLALLPVGSTEQHGPHAPLGTDTLNAESVTAVATERYEAEHDAPVVVGPAVPVGVSEEHRAFDGTLWVAPETFRAYVRETAESLAHHGLDRIVFVNGHGGNVDALREVGARLTRDGTARAVPFTWFDAVGEHAAEMGHAGPLETALLRHEHPDLVREDQIEAARDGASDRWGEWAAGVNLAYDSDEFSENGVVGDPAAGDADWGDELLDLAAGALCELLDAVANRP